MLVFGHRGACGYLPENTMASFELAFELGSDAIEFDVVMTADAVPVILHDDDLRKTTTYEGDDFLVSNWSLTELRELRVNERYPQRTQSASHDGRYPIPTLAEVLANRSFDGRHLIIEVKYGKQFQAVGLDIVAAVAKELEQSNYLSRGIKITIECFEFDILRQLRDSVQGPDFVFLSAPDTLPEGHFDLNEELLGEIAQEFDGVSVALSMLTSDFVARAKALGLMVFAYTARVETAQGDVDSWFKSLASTGVDGIFADQPDVLLKSVGRTL